MESQKDSKNVNATSANDVFGMVWESRATFQAFDCGPDVIYDVLDR